MRSALLVMLCGCSLFKSGPNSNAPTREQLGCSPSRAAPNVDVGFTIFYSIGVLAALEDFGDTETLEGRIATTFGTMAFGAAILQGLSAWSGYGKASRCEAAWNRLEPGAAVAPPGSERGVCRVPPFAACEPGLVCASGYCVRPPS